MIEPLEPRQHLDGGRLDATFGDAGRITIDFSNFVKAGASVTVSNTFEDHAGNLYVLAADQTEAFHSSLILLARLTHSGQLDTRFGNSGVLAMPRTYNQTLDAAVDSEGLLYVRDFTRVYRLTRSGRFDRTFAHGGKFTVPRLDRVFAMDTDDNGNLYLAGSDATTVRINHEGKLDTSWADDGVFIAPSSEPANIFSNNVKGLRATARGKLIIAIESTTDAGSDPDGDTLSTRIVKGVQLNSDGSIDTTYGASGIATEEKTDAPGAFRQVLVDTLIPDGEIVVTEGVSTDPNSSSTWLTVRISADGKNTTAVQVFPDAIREHGGVEALPPYAQQSDGKILSGYQSDVFRVDATGMLDATWGAQGVVNVDGAGAPFLSRDGSVYALVTSPNHWSIQRFWRDDAPVAQLEATTVSTAMSRPAMFSVSWRDDDGIDHQSIGARDIFVETPKGERRSARLSEVTQTQPGVFRAVYKFSAPGASWNARDGGDYTIFSRSDAVHDIHDTGNAGHSLGEFRVNI